MHVYLLCLVYHFLPPPPPPPPPPMLFNLTEIDGVYCLLCSSTAMLSQKYVCTYAWDSEAELKESVATLHLQLAYSNLNSSPRSFRTFCRIENKEEQKNSIHPSRNCPQSPASQEQPPRTQAAQHSSIPWNGHYVRHPIPTADSKLTFPLICSTASIASSSLW